MFFKRILSVFIIVLSVSLVVSLHSGCEKSKSDEEVSEKIEIEKKMETPEKAAPEAAEEAEEMEAEEEAQTLEKAAPEAVEEAEEMEEAEEAALDDNNPRVIMETTMGNVEISLFQKEAPITVENFLNYVKDGFYDGTIFHRVIPDFMIQGGGFTSDMIKKETKPPIKNEANNKIKNEKGTIAMARTAIIDSATSQFFINLKDNQFLDYKDETNEGYGYCVFGKVVKGMDVVENIGNVTRTTKGQHADVPETPVVINSIRIVENL